MTTEGWSKYTKLEKWLKTKKKVRKNGSNIRKKKQNSIKKFHTIKSNYVSKQNLIYFSDEN